MKLPKFLSFPPAVLIPKQFIDVESVSQLAIRDAPQVAYLLKVTALSNCSASRIANNLKKRVQDIVYEILYPEDYDTERDDMDADMED